MVDLFAGIGGFSYAAHHFGITTDVFVEKEKYCQKVLNKNFPGVPIVDDIFDFNVDEYERITDRRATDIICGGFPCQPFSLAGQRKGKEDDRHLWPQMFRVISELQPRWVIAENVYGLVNIQNGLVFETVCTDLESQGYSVQTFIIPAASKNAPHKRDRLWIVANRTNPGPEGMYQRKELSNGSNSVTNSDNKGLQGRSVKGSVEEKWTNHEKQFTGLSCTNWLQFPTQSPVCGRNDGIPNRVDRIKALGNAIVPQVAMEIFRSIIEVENANIHI